jgi:ring-1,2-phenylacetyl-CoA epoxidase subunit PaaD
MVNNSYITAAIIWDLLEQVKDPEVPVLTIIDLGIVKQVIFNEEKVVIKITPTYSGCPAMDVISMSIKMKLLENGVKDFAIEQVLDPAWTTDWMSEAGKEKLKTFGIAPPQYKIKDQPQHVIVPCPKCGATQTSLVSQFGSTSCKALYTCNNCLEPFDYFKCH